jgi:hypothetical protein
MNNEQFRKLLLQNNAQSKNGTAASPPTTARAPGSSTPSILGARKTSSIPMTPRQLHGKSNTSAALFAKQLAEKNAKGNSQRKFKSSVPKGVKLAAGFTDRTKGRKNEDGEDEDSELQKRIKALEELVKAGAMDRETFERTVQEVAGGDIAKTHLVKGLDRKLLEKVRQGELSVEDSLKIVDKRAKKKEGNQDAGSDSGSEVEDEFDQLAERDIAPVAKEKTEKKGEKAPSMPPPVAGVKRSRDAILAELKAQRQAAAAAAAAEHEKRYPSLGPGFRKVAPGGETTRMEIDSRGREVLIITDAEGNEKRKVRKHRVEPEVEARNDIEKTPLKIPEMVQKKEEEEEEDEDIFEGVGSNYNPLADIEGDDDEDDESEEGEEGEEKEPEPKPSISTPSDMDTDADTTPKPHAHSTSPTPPQPAPADIAPKPSDSTPAPAPQPPKPKRDYFASTTKPSSSEPPTDKPKHAADATILSALAKARSLDPTTSTLLADTPEARLARKAAELRGRGDRDLEDMDLGFGGSRFDDAEDLEAEDGRREKFSEWRGLGAEDDEDDDGAGGGGAKKKRKRGPKKKKGDKNSVADVMKVVERNREKGKTLG